MARAKALRPGHPWGVRPRRSPCCRNRADNRERDGEEEWSNGWGGRGDGQCSAFGSE